eukprot:946767-Amphidinium_carterae.1
MRLRDLLGSQTIKRYQELRSDIGLQESKTCQLAIVSNSPIILEGLLIHAAVGCDFFFMAPSLSKSLQTSLPQAAQT